MEATFLIPKSNNKHLKIPAQNWGLFLLLLLPLPLHSVRHYLQLISKKLFPGGVIIRPSVRQSVHPRRWMKRSEAVAAAVVVAVMVFAMSNKFSTAVLYAKTHTRTHPKSGNCFKNLHWGSHCKTQRAGTNPMKKFLCNVYLHMFSELSDWLFKFLNQSESFKN